MPKLTPKQQRFADEYLIDLNATQAYKRAGYSVNSDNAAGVEGLKLLRNPKIQDYIEKRQKDREKRTEITQDRVLQEYAKIGFSDIKNFIEFKTAKSIIGKDGDGENIIDWRIVLAVKDSEEVDGSLISEVSIAKDGTLKFKLHDKMNALEKLGKHLGMFKDNPNAGKDDELTVNIVNKE